MILTFEKKEKKNVSVVRSIKVNSCNVVNSIKYPPCLRGTLPDRQFSQSVSQSSFLHGSLLLRMKLSQFGHL